MKASELRDRDVVGLDQELSELLRTQFGLRIQKATQQLQNTGQLRKVRCDTTHVHTMLGQEGNQR